MLHSISQVLGKRKIKQNNDLKCWRVSFPDDLSECHISCAARKKKKVLFFYCTRGWDGKITGVLKRGALWFEEPRQM